MPKTTIEWTERNWNPFYGCRRKSAGCENCYAEQMASRFSGTDKNGKIQPYAGIAQKISGKSRWTGAVKLNEKVLLEPLANKKPTKYFVNSMSDTFYSKFPGEWIDKLFAVMALCPQHTFQILTKRPERMRDYVSNLKGYDGSLSDFWIGDALESAAGKNLPQLNQTRIDRPLENVWLGVSCENQQTADERIPFLLDTPAAVRFLSCEPLLGEINLTRIPTGLWTYGKVDVMSGYLCGDEPDEMTDWEADPDGWIRKPAGEWERGKHGVDWVICDGESGIGARPCHTGWIRSIVRQCKAASVPVFVKQLGGHVWIQNPNSNFDAEIRVKLQNKKGGDISEFPADLQVRDFPLA